MSQDISQLRQEAKEEGLEVTQQSANKWLCIRLRDRYPLAVERSEYLALSCGLVRTKFL